MKHRRRLLACALLGAVASWGVAGCDGIAGLGDYTIEDGAEDSGVPPTDAPRPTDSGIVHTDSTMGGDDAPPDTTPPVDAPSGGDSTIPDDTSSAADSSADTLELADSTPGDTAADAGLLDSSVDGATTDSGTVESGPSDSGADDAGRTDSGTVESGTTDTGTTDTGTTDTGTADTGTTDTGTSDTGTADAGSFTLGGTVTGLNAQDTLVLSVGATNVADVSANGSFTFPHALPSGTSYTVTAASLSMAPVPETCTIVNGTGTITGNVTNVTVTCAVNTYPIGGTVTGLAAGASVSLLDNGGDTLVVSSANTSFTFATALASGAAYHVTVGQQPIGQLCTVTNGSGTVSHAVTNVVVSCVNTYTVGGTISGLANNETVTLTDNGTFDSDPVVGNGQAGQSFTFSKVLTSGTMYTVAVGSSPTAPVSETCVVASGGGPAAITANVTNVTISCTPNKFTIGGTVTLLEQGASVVLSDNSANPQTVTAAGSTFQFSTQIASGQTYAVSVMSPATPLPETCTVSGGGTGTVANANVSLTVACFPTACGTGTDEETGAPWVVCSSSATSAIVSSANAVGGTYHAAQICASLGYMTLGAYGNTNGDVCGNNVAATDSCSSPEASSTFDSTGDMGTDANGIELGPTEFWTCTP